VGADTPRGLLLAAHLVPEALVRQPGPGASEVVAEASKVALADEAVVEAEAGLAAIEDLVVVEEVDLAEDAEEEEEASVVGAAVLDINPTAMVLQTALQLVPEAHEKVVSAVDAAAVVVASVGIVAEIATAAIDEEAAAVVGMIADLAARTTSLLAAGESGRRVMVGEMVGMAVRTRESVGTRAMGMRIQDSGGGIEQRLVRKGLSKVTSFLSFASSFRIEGKTRYSRLLTFEGQIRYRQERVSTANELHLQIRPQHPMQLSTHGSPNSAPLFGQEKGTALATWNTSFGVYGHAHLFCRERVW
jgi:hypothetical protein